MPSWWWAHEFPALVFIFCSEWVSPIFPWNLSWFFAFDVPLMLTVFGREVSSKSSVASWYQQKSHQLPGEVSLLNKYHAWTLIKRSKWSALWCCILRLIKTSVKICTCWLSCLCFNLDNFTFGWCLWEHLVRVEGSGILCEGVWLCVFSAVEVLAFRILRSFISHGLWLERGRRILEESGLGFILSWQSWLFKDVYYSSWAFFF